MKTNQRTGLTALLVCVFIVGTSLAYPLVSVTQVSFEGEVETTDLSGFKGTPFTLGDSGSSTQAVFSVSNWEASDEPCKTTIGTEDLNNANNDRSFSKALCNSRSPGDEIKLSFEDAGPAGSRAFITGIRVCMNNDQSKVKGLDIRGMKITDAGALVVPGRVFPCGEATSPNYSATTYCEQPRFVTRPNADQNGGWKKWSACSQGSLATAVVIHYAGGSEPRSLTGIELKCRKLKVGP